MGGMYLIYFYSKRIRETYMTHTSWKIIKREESMCDEIKENLVINRKKRVKQNLKDLGEIVW